MLVCGTKKKSKENTNFAKERVIKRTEIQSECKNAIKPKTMRLLNQRDANNTKEQ